MASRYRRPHPTAPTADPSLGSSWPGIADFASQPRATQADSPDLPALPDILDLPDLPDFTAITAPPADLLALPDLGGDLSDLLVDHPGTPAAFARRYTLAPRVLKPALDFVVDENHDLDVILTTPSSPLPARDAHAAEPVDEVDLDQDLDHSPAESAVAPGLLTRVQAVSPARTPAAVPPGRTAAASTARAPAMSPVRMQPAAPLAPPSPPTAISPLVSSPTRSSSLPMPLGQPDVPDPGLGDADDDEMQLDDTAEDAFDAMPPAPAATAPSAEPRAVPAPPPPPPPENDEDEDEFGFLRSDRRVHRARLQYPHLLRAATSTTASLTSSATVPSTPARAPPATSAAAQLNARAGHPSPDSSAFDLPPPPPPPPPAPQPSSDDEDDDTDFFTYRPDG
ncbi:hypothetical protein AMAG_11811 [Allomyces macrogynus ATCC 38327]|uniref:Uncharacterized protein n=1 Tax=Allomyces macrogynus (strain ATCC 38327) TaxID=578462 RepID=A0A0L0SXW8_ALLM3|nr:hypothetical protein AMAG_11811 [Allomyces macrogynus ATCC 38327]|eukprot:KNE67341.1 hypothetical protein AMAG_11811 [Allomyces macrogynus ATCC 38327]